MARDESSLNPSGDCETRVSQVITEVATHHNATNHQTLSLCARNTSFTLRTWTCDVMCDQNCTLPDFMNRVRTKLVRVTPSKLILGESGLFACQDIEEGTVVACFVAVRELREERRVNAPD